MSPAFRISIYADRRRVVSEEQSGAVELGRLDRGDHRMYAAQLSDGRMRIAIADKDEISVARRQLLVEPVADGRVRLTNLSTKVSLRLQNDQSELLPTASRETWLPVTLRIGSREVRIAGIHLESLAEAPLPPGAATADRSLLHTIAGFETPQAEMLIPWLKVTMDVVQGATTSSDSYERAASALVDMIGLDAGRVIMFEGETWTVKTAKMAAHLAGEDVTGGPWQPSSQVLTSVREDKKTFWQVPSTRSESIVGIQALVASPILDGAGQVIGALYGDRSGDTEGRRPDGRPITRLDAMLVQLLASGVAAGLAHKRLVQVERELEIGRQIQAGFLPHELPSVPGWEMAAHFQPAREVSGDFYDAFVLPSGHVALVVADVCDKGVGSALYMTLFRSLIRAFAEQAARIDADGIPPRPGVIAQVAVERTNAYVARTHGWQCMFCTLFVGLLDTASNTLAYVNAGHDPPIVFGPGGVRDRLIPTGPVVGIKADAAYDVGHLVLKPGEGLFAYTDGVTEARDPAGQFLTETNLLSLFRAAAPSVADLVSAIVARLSAHIGDAEPHDDVTMMVARRLP